MTDVVIVDSGCANISSVRFALDRIGVMSSVSRDPSEIRSANKIILPGVGAAATIMQALQDASLESTLRSLSQPVMGICLGMQILFNQSEEGETPCLGIFDDNILRFNLPGLVVPHMGWNTISFQSDEPIFKDIPNNADVYFVHSFYAPINNTTIASSNYGVDFTAAVRKDNFVGCQFHPERSGDIGAEILKNFVRC